MIDTKVEIENYFQELGVKSYKNILQFWSALDEEYGMTRARQLESAYIKLNEGDEAAFYSTIYEEYDVGIAFSSLRINLYQVFVDWLSNYLGEKVPDVIYDLGCGNGILTCLYAKIFPDSKIYGFDISNEAINIANILKSRLKLENVEFVVCDIKKDFDKKYQNKADLVISVASIDPIYVNDTQKKNQNLTTLCKSIEEHSEIEPLNAVSALLKDEESAFISFDKVKTLENKLRRINSINKSQMMVDYIESSWLSYQDIEQEVISLPCFVSKKSDQPGSLEESICFLASGDSPVLSLDLTEGKELDAELTFTYINPKKFVKGARADYRDGTGTIWQEIWQAGPIVLIFEHSNHGYRGLTLKSLTRLNESMEMHDTWIAQSKNYAEVEILTKPDLEFNPLSSLVLE